MMPSRKRSGRQAVMVDETVVQDVLFNHPNCRLFVLKVGIFNAVTEKTPGRPDPPAHYSYILL